MLWENAWFKVQNSSERSIRIIRVFGPARGRISESPLYFVYLYIFVNVLIVYKCVCRVINSFSRILLWESHLIDMEIIYMFGGWSYNVGKDCVHQELS